MRHKPLNTDRLGGIATRIQYDLHGSADDIKADLEDLLQDAMYWREAVKNMPQDVQSIGPYFSCPFCRQSNIFPHKPECPWLLAQDK